MTSVTSRIPTTVVSPAPVGLTHYKGKPVTTSYIKDTRGLCAYKGGAE
jgi:hypothetical protein